VLNGLTEGESISAIATATDPAGNTAQSGVYAFTVDISTAPPTVTSAALGAHDVVSLTGSAEPSANVFAYANGGATPIGQTTADDNGVWTFATGPFPSVPDLRFVAEDAAGNSSLLSASGSVRFATASYATVTGTTGSDYFVVQCYGDTLNGGGGNDLFVVDGASGWYNAFGEANGGTATIEAGVDDAFIGLSTFASGNGVATIDVDNRSGVTIGGSGSTLDLSGVTIANGAATLLANQAYQKVTGTAGADTFTVQTYGDTLNGGGGNDLFVVDGAAGWYNAFGEANGGAATIEAGADGAFIGLSNFASGNGVTTIDVDNRSGVTIGGSGAALDLSGVTIENGAATILANQAYQTIKGAIGDGSFELASYGDSIWGGGGSDTFRLLDGLSGSNTIAGFNSSDLIDLSDLPGAWEDFAALSAHISQAGVNASIDLGGGRTLTLSGAEANELTAAEFKFS
jgi:hypothetical protein